LSRKNGYELHREYQVSGKYIDMNEPTCPQRSSQSSAEDATGKNFNRLISKIVHENVEDGYVTLSISKEQNEKSSIISAVPDFKT
jgi:hypothetical protein